MKGRKTHGAKDHLTGKPLFPVLIDLSEKTVLVLSGNEKEQEEAVAYLRALAPCAGKLWVLSQSPSDALREMVQNLDIRLMEKEYEREDLYGADLVVCTVTDPAVKDDVFAACRTLGIRLQITTEPRRSDYILAVRPEALFF